jgi:hypothetical protein
MKISKETLKKIIKEEIAKTLNEAVRQAGSLDVNGIQKVIGQAAQPLIDKYNKRMVMICMQSITDPSNLEIHGPDGYTGIDMPLQDFKSKGYRLSSMGHVSDYVKQQWEREGHI